MITGVTGMNGAGKTAFAVSRLRWYASRGIPTFANIGVKGSTLIRDFEHLMSLRDCVVLLDEITAIASSRQSQSLPPEALLFFQTLRHSNVGCFWTAPTFERADLALRSLTLRWVALTPLVKTTPKGGIWANTHVSLVRSGRPLEGADGVGAKMANPWFSLYRPARNHADYDSFADVELFTRMTKFPRTCPNCGVGVNYGAQPVSLIDPGASRYSAEYFCNTCGQRLGVVSAPLSRAPREDAATVEIGSEQSETPALTPGLAVSP